MYVCVCFMCRKCWQGQASEARLAGCFPASTVCVPPCASSACMTPHVHTDPGRKGGGHVLFISVVKEGVRGAERLLLSRTSRFRCGPGGQCRLSFPGRCCFGITQCELAT